MYLEWGNRMISYEPFWQTLKQKDISGYALIHKHNISSGTLNRLRSQAPISTVTLNNLCATLDCRVQDVLEYVPDKT